MTEEQLRGRKVLLVHIGLVLAITLLTIGTSVAVRGPGKLPAQTIRVAIEIALFALVYRGNNVARWITIVLVGLAGAAAYLGLVFLEMTALPTLLMGSMGLIYLSFARVLGWSPTVAAFLAYQRDGFEYDSD